MPSLELIVARTIQFTALMALVGGFAFLLFIARPVFAAVSLSPAARKQFHRRILSLSVWSLVAVVASAAAWLALQAAIVSGRPLAQALSGPILSAVLQRTVFGEVMQIRLGIAVALAVLLWFGRRRYGPG